MRLDDRWLEAVGRGGVFVFSAVFMVFFPILLLTTITIVIIIIIIIIIITAKLLVTPSQTNCCYRDKSLGCDTDHWRADEWEKNCVLIEWSCRVCFSSPVSTLFYS